MHFSVKNIKKVFEMNMKSTFTIIIVMFLLTTQAFTQVVPIYVPTNGLVGWWSFDGNALDASTNGNHGTIYGPAPTLDRYGTPNMAYEFDGINDKIVIPNILLPNAFTSHTTAVWAKTSSQAAQTIYTDRGPGSYWYKNTSTLNVNNQSGFAHGATNNYCVNGTSTPLPLWNGTWHQMVSVYDHVNQEVKLFLDGQLIVSQTGITPYCHGNVSQSTTIGCFTGGGWPDMNFFNGTLDDLGIWNRALTSCEIHDLFTSQLGTNSTTFQTACDTFLWNGNTYSQSGQYVFNTTNLAGCDSTATLNLVIINSSSSTSTQTACDSIYWNGNILTQSGQYLFQATNELGCDSTAILDLILNRSSVSYTTLNSCDSAIWNASTYEQSGQYVFHTSNLAGCDSTAVLDLTINNSSSDTVHQLACDSYFWNGTTYTQGGQYNFFGTNTSGCDSNSILFLTIDSTSINSQPLSTTVSVGGSAQFTIAVLAFNPTYQWQMNNGFGYVNLANAGQFSGTNTQSLIVSNVQLIQDNSQFRCLAIGSNGCSDTSNFATLSVNANVGITTSSPNGLFSIYPNPARTQLHINLDEGVLGAKYYINDLSGRILLSGQILEESIIIDISKLATGVYRFATDISTNATKLIVY